VVLPPHSQPSHLSHGEKINSKVIGSSTDYEMELRADMEICYVMILYIHTILYFVS